LAITRFSPDSNSVAGVDVSILISFEAEFEAEEDFFFMLPTVRYTTDLLKLCWFFRAKLDAISRSRKLRKENGGFEVILQNASRERRISTNGARKTRRQDFIKRTK
jgi:hypothetical protein